MAGSDYLIFPQNKTIQRSSLVGWFMTLLENGIVKLGLLTFTAAQAPLSPQMSWMSLRLTQPAGNHLY